MFDVLWCVYSGTRYSIYELFCVCAVVFLSAFSSVIVMLCCCDLNVFVTGVVLYNTSSFCLDIGCRGSGAGVWWMFSVCSNGGWLKSYNVGTGDCD